MCTLSVWIRNEAESEERERHDEDLFPKGYNLWREKTWCTSPDKGREVMDVHTD